MVLLKQPERKVMKRNVIAVLLSVALAAGSFGPAPLYAAEVTTQDTAGVSSENDTLTNGEDLSDEAPAEEAEPPTASDKLLFMVFATEFAVSETTLETVFFKRLSKKPI